MTNQTEAKAYLNLNFMGKQVSGIAYSKSAYGELNINNIDYIIIKRFKGKLTQKISGLNFVNKTFLDWI